MNSVAKTSVKWTYVTHRLDRSKVVGVQPLRGDEPRGTVVLARVLSIGRHKELENVHGAKRTIFPGDVIVGALGDRYATDQFEGRGQASGATGHILGIGGVCGEVVSRNDRMIDPTPIEWIGAAADAFGRSLSLQSFGLQPRMTSTAPRPRTLLSVGASMNSGKTTTAAQMIRSLALAGHRVVAAKITGTACRKDPAIMEDAGAVRVLDFTHFGFPSTAGVPADELLGLAAGVRAALLEERPEFIVYEIADGIYQRETKILLEEAAFRATIDGVTFAGPDSVCCEGGVRHLQGLGYPVIASAGIVANSRLGMEEARAATGLPCLNGEMMLNGAFREALEVTWAA